MDNAEDIVPINYEQFEYAVSIMNKCTDDYMFMFDFDRDYYSISKKAEKRFRLPSNCFYNASTVLQGVVHIEDLEFLNKDLEMLKNGEKTVHNIEYRWLDKESEVIWISCRGQLLKDENGKRFLIGRICEIGTAQKADNITGFLRESQLRKYFNSYIKANKEAHGYIMKVGVDNFKEINEQYGMEVGDFILKSVAICLDQVANICVEKYRMNGDGFLLFSPGGQIEEAKKIFSRLKGAIVDYTEKINYKVFYTISAGIVEFPKNGTEYCDIQKLLEFAFNRAKKEERGNVFVFEKREYDSYIRNLDIQEYLRVDVENDFKGFSLCYQPLFDVDTGELTGAEALLRWYSEKYGPMSPVEFIPILEKSGLIIPVGRWVLYQAVKQCKIWQKYISNFRMNINLSYIQFKKSDIMSDIIKCIDKIGISSQDIVLELTESGDIETDAHLRGLMRDFRRRKIKLAIDDFGSGYSNLRYLQELQVDMIKIDRTFVNKAMNNLYDFKLIAHIIDMAHSIDLQVCLEGIETKEEMYRLKELQPDSFQGYLFGKPVDAESFYKNNLENIV